MTKGRQTETYVCMREREGASSCSPSLTLNLCKVTDTHSATYTCVQVPADLQIGMVRVWPEKKNKEKQTKLSLRKMADEGI